MKKLGLLAVLLMGPLRPAAASNVYATIGPLSLTIPWQNMNAVYLYNETAKISQVGGEVVLAQLKIGSYQNNPVDLNLTAGGVVDPASSNVGTGFAGINIWLPNPLPQFAVLNTVQPGLFAGYAITPHQWQFGLKAAINIFKGS